MKRVLFILAAALSFSAVSAQTMDEKALKKATKVAQNVVKNAKSELQKEDGNLNSAKQAIDKAMKDPLTKDWSETWAVAATVYEQMYKKENNKTYLAQPYDTVAMYDYLIKWYDYAIKADALEQIPNAKGKTSTATRDKFGAELDRNRTNLINGGIFYFNHRQDYSMAYNVFAKYYEVCNADLLASYNDNPQYADYAVQFAYFPTIAAMQMEDYEKVLTFCDLGITDEENGESCYRFKCIALQKLNRQDEWIEALKEGINLFPTEDFYYMQLLAYYDEQENMEEMTRFVEEMLVAAPEKAYNHYVSGYVKQNKKDYAGAIEAYKNAIERNPELTEAYINCGLCYMIEANDYMDTQSNLKFNSKEYKAAIEKEKTYYQDAMPYFEKVRELIPDETNKWGLQLYQIYYKLNMGPEFDKIETILKAEGLL